MSHPLSVLPWSGAWCARELRILARCLLSPTEALLSKLAFLIGLAYLVGPVDLIPDRTPYIGHLDEIGFVLAGLVFARIFAPETMAPVHGASRATKQPAAETWYDGLCFRARVLRADLSNFFLFQYRGQDGFLITGKNSGTHWVKYMLSCAIARRFGVPAPERASGRSADAIIGHPKWQPVHSGLPRIASSHTIPSAVFTWRLLTRRRAVPVVVLVRDIREALLSNHVKWRDQYGVGFSEYLRGNPLGRRYVADIWWYIHFFNRWGDYARAWPGATLIVRYEDVQDAPVYWIQRISTHLGVPLPPEALAAALPFIRRDAVQSRLDPEYGEAIIPESAQRARAGFTESDRAVFDSIVRRHLRHELGYDYGLTGRATAARSEASARARLAL